MNQEQLERLAHFEAQRMKRNEYSRKYRAEHPDKVKQWRLNHALNITAQAQENKGGEQ